MKLSWIVLLSLISVRTCSKAVACKGIISRYVKLSLFSNSSCLSTAWKVLPPLNFKMVLSPRKTCSALSKSSCKSVVLLWCEESQDLYDLTSPSSSEGLYSHRWIGPARSEWKVIHNAFLTGSSCGSITGFFASNAEFLLDHRSKKDPRTSMSAICNRVKSWIGHCKSENFVDSNDLPLYFRFRSFMSLVPERFWVVPHIIRGSAHYSLANVDMCTNHMRCAVQMII